MFNREYLITLMENNHISAYKLARMAGIAQSTISNIITGINVNPSTNTVSKIAEALSVPINDLFTFTQVITPCTNEEQAKTMLNNKYQKLINGYDNLDDDKRRLVDNLIEQLNK